MPRGGEDLAHEQRVGLLIAHEDRLDAAFERALAAHLDLGVLFAASRERARTAHAVDGTALAALLRQTARR